MKYVIRYTLYVILVSSLWSLVSGPANAQLWVENWNRGGYYTTNFEKSGFSAALLRSESRLGLHFIPLGETFIDPYVAYYGIISQDTAYWNNNLILGAGVRIRPFLAYKGTSWTDEWLPDLRIFYESLTIQYLKERDKALDVDKTKTNDTRYGLDLWHEWNLDKPDPSVPWAELWANYVYRETNFQSAWAESLYGSFKGYLLYFQPKIGLHLGRRAEPYLKADLTTCSQPFSWLNNLDYGLGIRIEPFRDEENHSLRKLKIFVEYLKRSYLKSSPAESPPPSTKPDNDIRIGLDLTYGL